MSSVVEAGSVVLVLLGLLLVPDARAIWAGRRGAGARMAGAWGSGHRAWGARWREHRPWQGDDLPRERGQLRWCEVDGVPRLHGRFVS